MSLWFHKSPVEWLSAGGRVPHPSHCPAGRQKGERRVRTACLDCSKAKRSMKSCSCMYADRVRHGGRPWAG